MKYLLLSLALCFIHCSNASQNTILQNLFSKHVYLIILAHPDDETWMNGTLARLAQQKKTIHILYATSGGEGNDYSGQNLAGPQLARVREQETRNALKLLGVVQPPSFLRHQDKELSKSKIALLNDIENAIDHIHPDVIFTFEPNGITGHKDHKLVQRLTKQALAKADQPIILVPFAVSKKRATILATIGEQIQNPYRIKHSYDDSLSLLNIQVNKVTSERINAFAAYPTQFPESLQTLWQAFVVAAPYEEFLIIEH